MYVSSFSVFLSYSDGLLIIKKKKEALAPGITE